MTVKHIVWGKEKIGEEALSTLKAFHDQFLQDRSSRFYDYLASPFFNKNERLTDLYRRILSASEKGNEQLRAKIILSQWNKGRKQKITLDYIRLCLDKINENLLDFLAYNYLKDNEDHKWRLLQKYLRNKHLPLYLTKVKGHLKEHNANRKIGFTQLLDDFHVAYNDYYELETDREQRGLDLLTKTENNLERLYQTYQAKFACERINLEKAAKQNNSYSERSKELPPTPLQRLYHLSFRLHDSPGGFSLVNYHAFTNAFIPLQEHLNETDRYILCKYTINALGRAIKKGKEELRTELFSWMKKRLEWTPKTVRHEGVNDYLNTVNVACTCGDLAYAKYYLETYRSKLPPEYSDRTYYLGLADVLFREQKYLQIIELLKENHPKHSDAHFFFILRAKALRLRSCIEVLFDSKTPFKTFDTIDKTYEAAHGDFRKYLKRKEKEIPGDFHLSHSKLMNYIHAIYLVSRTPISQKEKKEKGLSLLLQLEKEEKVVARNWLLNLIKRHLK